MKKIRDLLGLNEEIDFLNWEDYQRKKAEYSELHFRNDVRKQNMKQAGEQ